MGVGLADPSVAVIIAPTSCSVRFRWPAQHGPRARRLPLLGGFRRDFAQWGEQVVDGATLPCQHFDGHGHAR